MKRRSQPKQRRSASPYTKQQKQPHWYGPDVQAVYKRCGKSSQYAEGR